MLTPDKCCHSYGYHNLANELITDWDYDNVPEEGHFVKFTYCPWCQTQVHTIDGEPLGLGGRAVFEDDCQRGGCED